ncbi:MAG: LPXTG cell wall anchor domain-containing protein, partial [Ruminococcus sp.]|nr:LPXTG cell wall anchor domain-containing protein [Ruminococcus sp.]
SNNPNNANDLGKAPEDTVWVATYQVLNYKFDGDTDEKLPGVGFELQDSTGAKIVLAYDATNNVYYPKGDNDTAADLVSGEDGTFNIKGLDAGTYKLVETAPLPGYNTCGDITIVIEATHEEDGAGTGATVEMTKAEGVDNEIENNQGSTLPGTGGIGTTVFYLGGGAMVAVAGIYLISKKRMKNTQE